MLKLFINSEDGQSLVEYSLIISIAVIVVISALFSFGSKVFTLYESNKDLLHNSIGEK